MKVLVIGLGTIGKPLIQLFLNVGKAIGVEELIFHKNTPELKYRGVIVDFHRAGAKLAVYKKNLYEFKALLAPYGIVPDYAFEKALERSDVVIACTPQGVGLRLKETYFRHYKGKKLFVAQGSEAGFGTPYAFDINDAALCPQKDRYVHVVSCNTHQLLCILKTLVFDPHQSGAWDADNLVRARFYLGRRASDISQTESTVGVEAGIPECHPYGSHQGRDAADVLRTIIDRDFDIYTVADVLPNPFMHVAHFDITLREAVTIQEVEARFRRNKLVAVTYWQTNNEVFAEGRDRGHYGRILNQIVVCLPTLAVRDNGHEIIGRCFTPQDGNPLLSTVAAALWFFDPEGYRETIAKHLFKRPFLFEEV